MAGLAAAASAARLEESVMIEICDCAAVPDNMGLQVEVPELGVLAVFRYEDGYYVTDDKCTHGNASLCEGEVFGEEVECPFHNGAFNFRTGAPTVRPCIIPLKTYRVQVEGGKVFVLTD